MPFTLAHPAAILPVWRFARRLTSLSALVIGSMSPDFVYFLPIGINGGLSHSMKGLFMFCVPAGMIAYAIFHWLVKQPMTVLMPEAISSRLNDQVDEWIPKTIGSLCCIVVSVLIGAATHVAWDAFTHGNTAIVRNTEFLRAVVDLAGGPKLPIYKILQHVSGVLGLTILASCVFHWMRRAPPTNMNPPQSGSISRGLIFGAILMAGVFGGVIHYMDSSTNSFERVVFNGVVGGMVGAASAALLYCTCWQVWNAWNKRRVRRIRT